MGENKEQYQIFQHISDVDISEQDIWDYCPEVLEKLLIDHTMSAKARRDANDPSKIVNIFWATGDYAESVKDEEGNVVSAGFRYGDEIKAENTTGKFGRVIMPRVLKDKQLQLDRTKDMAEVFTPSWVCNAQNNLIDEAWFGEPGKFNTEETLKDGTHTWTPTERVIFPEGDKKRTWKKYVVDNRMEITCGEAPYLVSRYDTTTGEPIPLKKRIGLLDRKLRVISENAETTGEWCDMARKAYMHTYGYEWQGDNLLLAREALLYTYIEYYIDRFSEKDAEGNITKLATPDKKTIIGIARIISWNLWQMDGIKMVVPDSCHETIPEDKAVQLDLFSDETPEPQTNIKPCPGCASGNVHDHNGVYCLIRDWNKKKPNDYTFMAGEDPKSSPWQKIKFSSLLYQRGGNDEEIDD